MLSLQHTCYDQTYILLRKKIANSGQLLTRCISDYQMNAIELGKEKISSLWLNLFNLKEVKGNNSIAFKVDNSFDQRL